MTPPTVYVDTSIFGGLFEPEFQHGSERFLELVNTGVYSLVVSDLVLGELATAPPRVREAVEAVLPLSVLVQVTTEAEQLRDAYLDHNVLGRPNEVDALHVAIASVLRCTAIVSWNFRHIVNSRRIPLFNAVNVLSGYNEIGIFTPHGVIGNEDTG